MKRCNQCCEIKSEKHFRKAEWVCKECRNLERRGHKLRTQYGLTFDEFSVLLDEQQGKCKVCEREFGVESAPVVDHDHSTGEVRGLLCSNCNSGLGMFKDDKTRLVRAIAYLQRVL